MCLYLHVHVAAIRLMFCLHMTARTRMFNSVSLLFHVLNMYHLNCSFFF